LEAVDRREANLILLRRIIGEETALALVVKQHLAHQHQLALVGSQNGDRSALHSACCEVVSQMYRHACLVLIDLAQPDVCLGLRAIVCPKENVGLNPGHLASHPEAALRR